jgi:hypothetical protein
VRKYLDDRASSLAALIAYYAFFSVFPLLIVFVSVLGFVLEDDPARRRGDRGALRRAGNCCCKRRAVIRFG